MSQHVVSPKIYIAIFAALMVLTGLTVYVARVPLGDLNIIVALAIAVTKASLVVLYFMHARYSPRLTWLVIASGFVFLAILIGVTISDYGSRDWLGVPGS